MSAAQIPIQEIDFHPTSFCDRGGRLFCWKGDIYRGIVKEKAAFCERLFADGIVRRLVEKKLLIETELTDLTLSGYPLVLKHRRLPFVSYANEWCPEMLRDSALLIADLAVELARDNLTFTDPDSRNILFDGCRPVYVDFCSFESASLTGNGVSIVYKEAFLSHYIYPLRLMAQGCGNLARWLLADYEHNVIQAEFAAFMGYPALTHYQKSNLMADHPPQSLLSRVKRSILHVTPPLASKGLRSIKSGLSRLTSNGELGGCDLVWRLRQELDSIPLPSTRMERTAGNEGFCLPLTLSDKWTEKQLSVHQVLSDLHPLTVLDIGCNGGWYSQLAASLGSKVVALDVDDRSVARCYREAQEKNLPILPLVMDIRYPSPGHGTGNKVLAPALQRLPCDMVLALSLIHLLVFKQHLIFEQMSETFATLSKRWLLVEFVPREDQEISQGWTDRHSWYTLENFMATLKKHFRIVSIMPSHPTPRVLLLCEKSV